jgi:hypothetical protein
LLPFSRDLSGFSSAVKNVKIEYECETLREANRLKMFENRVLRRILGLNMDEVKGGWRIGKMKNCMICTLNQI